MDALLLALIKRLRPRTFRALHFVITVPATVGSSSVDQTLAVPSPPFSRGIKARPSRGLRALGGRAGSAAWVQPHWPCRSASRPPPLPVHRACHCIAQLLLCSKHSEEASQKSLSGSAETIWSHQQISPFPFGVIKTLNKHDLGVGPGRPYDEPLSS